MHVTSGAVHDQGAEGLADRDGGDREMLAETITVQDLQGDRIVLAEADILGGWRYFR